MELRSYEPRTWCSLATFVCVVLAGCDLRVSDVPRDAASASLCVYDAAASEPVIRSRIEREASNGNYPCLEQQIDAAKQSAQSPFIAQQLTQLLAANGGAKGVLPDSTIVSAVGYLMIQPGTESGNLIARHVEVVRRVAMKGDEHAKSSAIAILSARRSDEDIGIFEAGVASQSERVLASSVFALAQNCSPSAQRSLVTALKSPSVDAYLRKYRERESLTTTVKRDCPAALG